MVVEGCEERYPETTIRHGVQQTVAGGCQKEICPHRESADIRQSASKSRQHNDTRQCSGKNKGVGETSVPPKVAVPDAKPESNHIEVGNYRARCADDPDSFRNAGLVKEREGNDAIAKPFLSMCAWRCRLAYRKVSLSHPQRWLHSAPR
jgi:hypothetical protein